MYLKHNEKGKIIISLSPIPLKATFQPQNSIVANMENKSMLRHVISEFSKKYPDVVSYFPSYEIVNVIEEDPFIEDNRHIKPETINRIMNFFKDYYVN